MRFFRRQSSPGLVALLAVAMQAALILAQAHVHAHRHVAAGAHGWATGAATMACRAIVRPQGCNPVVPHDHRHDCAMCWSLAAAGTGLLPPPAAAAVETPRFVALPPLRVAAAPPGRDTLHFQARAPPRV